MFEVEAKVFVAPERIDVLRKRLKRMAQFQEKTVIQDRYYNADPSVHLRLREKNKKAFLTIKSKKRGQGIEQNQEIEIPLASAARGDALLKKMGFSFYAAKEKRGEIFKKEDFTLELNQVKGLGCFLEIEILVRQKKEIPRAKKALRHLFKGLGFKPEDLEKRYYLEMLVAGRL